MRKLSELESKIINYIWNLGSKATVKEILEAWDEEKTPLYTTILKTLQIMEDKGIVGHEKSGRSYSYFPLITKKEVSGGIIRNLLSNFFGGNKMALATTLINDEKLSQKDIDDLKSLIKEKEDELKNKS